MENWVIFQFLLDSMLSFVNTFSRSSFRLFSAGTVYAGVLFSTLLPDGFRYLSLAFLFDFRCWFENMRVWNSQGLMVSLWWLGLDFLCKALENQGRRRFVLPEKLVGRTLIIVQRVGCLGWQQTLSHELIWACKGSVLELVTALFLLLEVAFFSQNRLIQLRRKFPVSGTNSLRVSVKQTFGAVSARQILGALWQRKVLVPVRKVHR